MAELKDQALCVRAWDWSETSQTAVLLTRDHGMVRAIAKGSKRDRSAFSGGLEVCTLGQMISILRPNSELALLTHWDLLEPMTGIRSSLQAYSVCMLGIDLVPRLIQDHDPHPEIHDALLVLLRACSLPNLGTHNDRKSIINGTFAWYLWMVLVSIGSMPVVDHDVRTGELLKPANVYGFSAQLGGVTQDPITGTQIPNQASGTTDNAVWRVRSSTVELMKAFGESPPVSRFQSESQDQLLRLSRLLGLYIRERVGTDIRAMDWLLKRGRE